MAVDLAILNGKIVTPQGIYEGDDIAVEKGEIVAIDKQGSFPEAKKTIDATGKYVLPGIIDVHVHFRQPGYEYKEDFETGSMAAAAGGVTTVCDMPNNQPFCSTVEAFQQKKESIRNKAYVDYGLVAAVVGETIEEIPNLAQSGINVFKIFMGATVGGVPAPDDGGMFRAFQLVAETGLRVGVHAENNAIMDYMTAKLKGEGRTDPLAHVEARPPIAEAESIQRAILFAGETGCKLHIYHLSSREGVQLIRAAQEKGVQVSAETGPHYLLLDCNYMKKVGSILKINPPVRSPEHGEALWQGLLDGTVEVIATDHSPHTLEEKIKDNIWEAIPGFTGVETKVPLMLTQVNEGRLSLMTYVKVASENPARVFNLYPRKGTIQVGTDADFTIVDMEKVGIINSEKLHSKSKITPFDGWRVKGLPVYAIVRGNVVMKDGEIVGKPRGELIKPIV
ncbi:MAG: allantoinase AllB [Proteobacteria bacterium]|nr:allantoinase AllB [Pseudomonadota bacterium]